MKIKFLKIKNFRGYRDEVIIAFDNLTAFVGKNDIGKSSILEALDIFFYDGKDIIKIDKTDLNVDARNNGENEISITVCFEDLPESICIDATNETTLKEECLLNEEGLLEIVKKFPNGGTPKVFIRAFHPTHPECKDLLLKKDTELKKTIDSNQIPCVDRTRNAIMRRAIRAFYQDDLQMETIEIDVTKGDSKSIWEKLQRYLPLYSLFQSDRKNSDEDSEVQDPLKGAVKEILQAEDLQHTLDEVAATVEAKLREVSNRTLRKLREMDPDVASTLSPVIPSGNDLKWADVFKKVSISGDESIPINKRGSGVKRLILLNFFRAEVERRQEEAHSASVIYAIEEPETSQHAENQKKLIKALSDLASAPNTQVIITTHSSNIVKSLRLSDIRIVRMDNGHKSIDMALPNLLPTITLNEVNFLAFSEISEEYHDELYGYIEENRLLGEFKQGKPTVQYRRVKNGNMITDNITMTEYIRHQIHHPENTLNARFSDEQLASSIYLMRNFIQSHFEA